MAEYAPAYEKTLRNEGGYVLHTVEGDRGGMTYAGIARNYHPGWPGWTMLDAGHRDSSDLTVLVRSFYRSEFWDRINGDDIAHQDVAEAIYDFAVNAGVKTAAKLAQLVVGATPDGIIGPVTVERINTTNPETFILRYVLAKIARYRDICTKDPGQKRFLLGWLNRSLRGVS